MILLMDSFLQPCFLSIVETYYEPTVFRLSPFLATSRLGNDHALNLKNNRHTSIAKRLMNFTSFRLVTFSVYKRIYNRNGTDTHT